MKHNKGKISTEVKNDRNILMQSVNINLNILKRDLCMYQTKVNQMYQM